jgi:hypothetical protein
MRLAGGETDGVCVMTARTSYHAVTAVGGIACTFETLSHAVEWAKKHAHVVPGMAVKRIDTVTTEAVVWRHKEIEA